MTRAAILARYLGLNYESAPWMYTSFAGAFPPVFTAPDPLGDGAEVGAWLGALVQADCLVSLKPWRGGFEASVSCGQGNGLLRSACKLSDSPVHALIAAMRAADPAFDAEMERADG